ncbi:MAG: hypothetical protein AAGA92_07740 [Planctomycetota bacterium]
MKISLFRNETQDGGVFYSGKPTRGYRDKKDGDRWKDSQSFGGTDLLKLANLCLQAYQAEIALRAQEQAERNADVPGFGS